MITKEIAAAVRRTEVLHISQGLVGAGASNRGASLRRQVRLDHEPIEYSLSKGQGQGDAARRMDHRLVPLSHYRISFQKIDKPNGQTRFLMI